ncbi:HipA family kinase [Ruegeria halocynthiae]|uniref:HipA family kinase n=1 Tax=Ruegeria halocynthiae TaxID=985054 RepID=UPI00068DACFF|nr:HipA family kinase [Ruegeria halocynthiae]
MLEVIEIANAAGSGMTMPFLCRLSDEEFYYVKGRSLTCDGLVNEYIGAHLGRLLSLPIPEFEIAQLPDLSIFPEDENSPRSLGFGQVFASKRVPNLDDLDHSLIEQVPAELRRDVAVFDYWVGNEDRTLTETGGNPNLFWDVSGSCLTVFDHNLAFSDEYSLENALELHPFRVDLLEVLSDDASKAKYATRFLGVLTQWTQICSMIPDDWLFKDMGQTIEAEIDFQRRLERLKILCEPEGWGK